MGSYNVACSISGLTIDCGEKCGWIPLELPQYRKLDSRGYLGNDMLICSSCIFTPATLPIWGGYYDYGCITVDDEANNPLHLRICRKMLGFDDSVGIHEIESGAVLSGMFVLKSIYDKLCKPVLSDWNGKKLGREQAWTSVWKVTSERSEWDKEYYKTADHTWRSMNNNSQKVWWRDYGTHFKNCYTKFSGELEAELDRQLNFEQGMYACNKFYFPAMNGYQHGNHYMANRLAKATRRILKKKLKQMEKDKCQ